MIMKNLIMLIFILCMGTALCVAVCSEYQDIQLIAAVEFVLASFALGATNKLVTKTNK
jgi:hypothetical protein